MKSVLINIWKSIVFIASWLYIIGPLFIFSVIANAYHLFIIIITGKLLSVKREMRDVKSRLETVVDVHVEYTRFKYKFDGIFESKTVFGKWPTWIPLVTVLFYKQKQDNCDGADVYCRWLFRQLSNKYPQYNSIIAKRVIYVPYLISIKSLFTVHYFTIVGNQYEIDHNLYQCYSSGKITNETKEELALRLLNGNDKFLFIKK
jgi:hypothetical protein